MASTNFSPVTHVIFDMDGLLLDTEKLYTEAIQNVSSVFGKEFTWDTKVKCMGLKGDVAAKLMIDELQLPITVPQFLELVSKQYEIVFPTATLLPDTERLYTMATERVAAVYGKSYPWEVKVAQMGRRSEMCAKIITERLNLPLTIEEYIRAVKVHFSELFPTAQLMPDTVEIYHSCHLKTLRPFGVTISFDDMMMMMGNTALEVSERICSRFHLPFTKEEYRRQVSSLYPEVFPCSKLMKGADKLVRHLHNHKIPIAIATGGAPDSFELKTTNHKEFVSLFHHVVFASTDPEVKSGKPAPDVFLVCARRFPDNPDPQKCLVFEDAPNGLEAGRAAQMQVVMVPDPRLDKDLTKGASQILNSLEQFKPELYGLPPFES